MHRQPAREFARKKVLHSEEGITQDDPLSMCMYALGMTQVITVFQTGIKEVRYIDDATGSSRLQHIKLSWNFLVCQGPD